MRNRNNKSYFIALLLAVAFISGCGGGSGGGGEGATSGDSVEDTRPTATFTNPANSDTSVSLNRSIAATFSETMDSATITATGTYTLKETATSTNVPGTVTYTDLVATFDPTVANLTASTEYTATITTTAKDSAGNTLAADKTWSFTTGTTTDSTAPTVSSTIPIDSAINVSINRDLSATFSEAMNPTTITDLTFTLKQGGASVPGAVTYAGFVATFNPTSNLGASTLYDATITTSAQDLAGNALASNYAWSFTTGTTADTTAPTVTSTIPINNANDVGKNSNISATFSEGMKPSTITNVTFTLAVQGGASVSGDVSLLGSVATFNPTSNLADSTTYDATITTGAQDLAGNALASKYTWSFTTAAGTNLALGPAIVNLGTAGNFALLSKTGITDVPTSAITGNIGASPITGASITGITAAEVTGIIYTVDDTGPAGHVVDPDMLTTAISNMQTAYTDAAGRAIPDGTELYAGILTGQTFNPGLYTWSTGVSIGAGGAVTLSGDSNDVWIFQISGNLTLETTATVTLSGGALPKNIFWQVGGGTGATLKTGSTLNGNILTTKAIIMQSGATINGRALAQTAVTLISNTVTKPTD